MKRYLYLCLTPEALIISMLPPVEFGSYLAIGTKKRTRGQAMFFEVDQEKARDILPMDYIEKRCVPKEGNLPKNSVYLSIYRVLESVPLDALKSLYLTTDDGRTLELKQAQFTEKQFKNGPLHLYQELCPVTPRIASSLSPTEFMEYMTNEELQISVPKLIFAELILDQLAYNPISGSVANLPYPNVEHLRDCLLILRDEKDKTKKTVIRVFQGDLMFRTIKNGLFIGTKGKMLYYPMPPIEELEDKYYSWWRSAKAIGFQ